MGQPVDEPTMQSESACIDRTLSQHYNVEVTVIPNSDPDGFQRSPEAVKKVAAIESVDGIGTKPIGFERLAAVRAGGKCGFDDHERIASKRTNHCRPERGAGSTAGSGEDACSQGHRAHRQRSEDLFATNASRSKCGHAVGKSPPSRRPGIASKFKARGIS